MKFKALAVATTAAIAFAGSASALDLKITGNVEVDYKSSAAHSQGTATHAPTLNAVTNAGATAVGNTVQPDGTAQVVAPAAGFNAQAATALNTADTLVATDVGSITDADNLFDATADTVTSEVVGVRVDAATSGATLIAPTGAVGSAIPTLDFDQDATGGVYDPAAVGAPVLAPYILATGLVGDDSFTDGDWVATTDYDLDFAVSGSNCCFEYGGFVGIKGSAGAGSTTAAVMTDDAHIFIKSATMGRFEFGIDADGLQGMFDTDALSAGPISVGLDTHVAGKNANIANDTFTKTSLTGTGVEWSHTLGGLSVAAGYVPGATDAADDLWNASAKYALDLSGVAVTLGGAIDSSDATSLRATAEMSGYKLLAGYMDDDDGEKALYLGASTTIGGVSLSAEYASVESMGTSAYNIYVADLTTAAFNVTPLTGVANAALAATTGVHTVEETQIALNAAYTLAPGLVASAGIEMFDGDAMDMLTVTALTANNSIVNSGSYDGTNAEVRLKLSF